MHIFIHGGKDVPLRRVEVSSDTRVSEIIETHAPAAAALWPENAEKPAPHDTTLEGAGVSEGDRVYAGKCKSVVVTVEYADQPAKTHQMPPAATIAALLAWAVGPNGFNLPQAERAKHTLADCGTEEQADRTQHVGEYANDDCEACFDLVPKEKFEG
jgi:hypothetical protein